MIVNVDVKGINVVAKRLGATRKNVTVARARAIRATLKHVRMLVRRDAAKALKVPQKVLNKRLVTTKIKNTDAAGKLWAGTWDISPFALGAPSSDLKTKAIKVGSRTYRGAFMKPIFTSEPNIWIRLRSKYYKPDLYPASRKHSGAGSLPASLRHKFPVVKAAIRVDDTMATVFAREEKDIKDFFDRQLQSQINYAVNIEGALR